MNKQLLVLYCLIVYGTLNSMKRSADEEYHNPKPHKILCVVAGQEELLHHFNKNRKYALHQAVKHKNINKCRNLLQVGTDVTLLDYNHKTVFDYIGLDKEITALFQDYGYVVITSSNNRSYNFSFLIKNNGDRLKKLIENNTIEGPKQLFKQLFKTFSHWNNQQYDDKREFFTISSSKVVFRYPSEDYCKAVLGEDVFKYIKVIQTDWLIGQKLWNLIVSDEYIFVKNICLGKMVFENCSYTPKEYCRVLRTVLKEKLFKIPYKQSEAKAETYIQWLKRVHTNFKSKNQQGKNVLTVAFKTGLNIELLLKAGMDPNYKDKNNPSLLWFAIEQDDHAKAKLLLEYGAIVNSSMISLTLSSEMKEIIENGYNEQACCICCERARDTQLIPCINKHLNSFICLFCCADIKTKNNLCPLCRDNLY